MSAVRQKINIVQTRHGYGFPLNYSDKTASDVDERFVCFHEKF